MVVKVKDDLVDMLIVQAYLPTTDYEDEEVEKVYDQLEEILGKQKGTDNVIVIGDFNAVVGEGKEDRVVGKFGLGKRNDRTERLIEFCKSQNLVITNTWFEQEKRRRYTWKSPGDLRRYQIDYILVQQRYRNSVKSSWSYPGADVDSDHNLVAMRLKLKLKKIPRRRQQKKWKLDSLISKVKLFRKDIEEVQCFKQRTAEERLENLKGVVMKSAERNVGYLKGKVARKPWITTAIMEKMQERRKWKKNTEEGKRTYRRLNNELGRETDQARERWWKNECNELEELDQRARPDLVYAKVGQLTRKKTSNCTSETIKDETGKLLTEPEEIRNR